jgi:hypothetical protein
MEGDYLESEANLLKNAAQNKPNVKVITQKQPTKPGERTNDIPDSSPSRIIIKSREQSYSFEKDAYKEEYLSGIVTKKEFDDIIANASKIMGQSWSKKRLNDQIKIPLWVIVLSVISVILTIIYMITLYYSTTASNGAALLAISIVSVTIASIIAFSLSIYNFCRKIEKFKSLDEMIKEELDNYFNEINTHYEGNIKWKFITGKNYIECNINKSREKGEDKKSLKFKQIMEEDGK